MTKPGEDYGWPHVGPLLVSASLRLGVATCHVSHVPTGARGGIEEPVGNLHEGVQPWGTVSLSTSRWAAIAWLTVPCALLMTARGSERLRGLHAAGVSCSLSSWEDSGSLGLYAGVGLSQDLAVTTVAGRGQGCCEMEVTNVSSFSDG